MDNLLNKRRNIKGRTTRIDNIITAQGTTPWNSRSVHSYLQQLDQLWTELLAVHNEIGILCDTEDKFLPQQSEYDQLASRIEALRLKLPDTAAEGSSGSGRANGTAASSDAAVRLPKLDLPTFSGMLHEWTSFHDLFTATINKNDSLSGAQKLQYLKASLKGEAALLVQTIQVTDDNFKEAWQILQTRYQNKREIINAHLKRLFAQPTLTSESPTALRKLIDVTSETVRALRVLKVPVDQWDTILSFIMLERVDPDTRRQWELTQTTTEASQFKELMTFLEQRARALLSCGVPRPSRAAGVQERHTPTPRSAHLVSTSKDACRICQDRHAVYNCKELLQSSIQARRDLVKEHGLCFNCLSGDHQCKACKSSSCRKCGKRHHTLLHLASTQQPSSDQGRETASATHHGRLQPECGLLKQVLLATALVKIQDSQRRPQVCRALLDTGSQAAFVTEACVQRLGLAKQRTSVSVKGISATNVNISRGVVNMKMSSCANREFQFDVQALVLRKVTGTLPSSHYDTATWKHVPSNKLADPEYNVPNSVDVLLGADVYADFVQSGIRRGPPGTPIAQSSKLGWLISGHVNTVNNSVMQVSTNVAHLDLLQSVRRFWELEEVPHVRALSEEEQICENHFMSTYSRETDGRFTVRLPLKAQPVVIDSRESRFAAVRRLTQVERRLTTEPLLQQEYNAFLDEYERLGHMRRMTTTEAADSSCIYLPHHAVIKEDNTTTRLRVVFDASSKSRLGISLNDHLRVGPTLQEGIFNILLRFRTHAIALTADISKMYRQIRLHNSDTRYQNIVWRATPAEPPRDYRLTTLTYEKSSAPYLAVRCLLLLAREEETELPGAAKTAQRDFYVDDLMSGADTVGGAIQLREELNELLARGGFQLRKWVSNDPEVLKSIPNQLKEETMSNHSIESDGSVKTLGLQWNPTADHFSFCFAATDRNTAATKRSILSTIARIYDLMGWISPVTVKAKIILQELWSTPCTWDERLQANTKTKWDQYRDDLGQIEKLKIPRRDTLDKCSQHELHGFCDASEHAYAAAIYLKSTETTGNTHVALIAAKTRVSPIKKMSIPRLELCGALLLSNLFDSVQTALIEPVDCIHAWTDSMVVLAWINACSSRWKTFVANRVTKIQASVAAHHWRHVKGDQNPADCASRGISPSEIIDHDLWWTGPVWLRNQTVNERQSVAEGPNKIIREEERIALVVQIQENDSVLLNRFSALSTLTRVTVYVLRFLRNCRTPADKRVGGSPSSEELNQVLFFWIKTAQKHEFPQEMRCLNRKQSVPSDSCLASLNVYLDVNGLIRVGGRLHNSSLNIESKHPIVLPHKHLVTDMIIQQEHLRTLHSGPQLLLCTLQQRFWIIGGRNLFRKHVQNCITCWRQKATPARPMMGNLPAARVRPSRPFLRCGVDYAGPLTVRAMQLRGQKRFKAYVALFVCFSTHAIHMELVSDLTTDGFLAALKRFVARRGHCLEIHSDQGTNFVGAARELKDLYRLLRSPEHNQTVTHQLGETRTTWFFNPPAAPHFGGLWEAGVKSIKHHLRRIVGAEVLNFEEMTTVLTQIEACVNSRPLCPISSQPEDLESLTRGISLSVVRWLPF